ncbi:MULTISPECIES: histidinol-phosphate transaminase [unclassified Bacillus (in: firmicutes)]|uniref:histidinol-phosphate transaminase n=1 Tax=unclassified Bacillus (in: firmicutes) TaxID=185979 RepID=UPI00080ACE9D|nr:MULTISPECIES: histidinol-phosphate transaminase [unclassified Bacillus (in: firmicutes)]OCA83563.1 histidinol-phosphate transaminase [Bacillus sp. FJAT-27986]
MKWKNHLYTLEPYKPGKPIEDVKREFGLEEIIKLASNENPYGYSSEVAKTLKETEWSLPLYPDGGAVNLREVLSNYLGVEKNQLIFGNGSDNIIQMIAKAILAPGVNTVMSTGTFSQYSHNAILEQSEIREVPHINGRHDLDGMLRQIDADTGIVWICSPNNPTGEYIRGEELLPFLSQVPNDVLVVFDAAYYEYVTAIDYPEILPLINQFDNLILLHTFSKIYGMAALRIGYGVANSDIIRMLEPAREPFNVNALAQKAAIAAISDQQFIEECKQKNRDGLQQYYEFCKIHNLSYYPSQANFILIDTGHDGNEVFQYLMRKGFIVRSGQALGFPTSIRITVGSDQQNEAVLKELKNFLLMKENKEIK